MHTDLYIVDMDQVDEPIYVKVDDVLKIFPDGSFLQKLIKERIEETNTIKFLKEPVDMILAKE